MREKYFSFVNQPFKCIYCGEINYMLIKNLTHPLIRLIFTFPSDTVNLQLHEAPVEPSSLNSIVP